MTRLSRLHTIAAWTCGLSLMMVVGGYWAIWYRPMTPEERKQLAELQQYQALADEMTRHSSVGDLLRSQTRDAIHKLQKEPPFKQHGTVSLSSGGLLFILGMVLWYRNPPQNHRSGWTDDNDDA